MERFSIAEVLKQKYGEPEKNKKTARSNKRASSKGKYKVKIVNGVKYMTLD